MREVTEQEIFETLPVHKAVATLAVPTIISQIVSIIYNLADTFFIGQLGNPYMVAAATLFSALLHKNRAHRLVSIRSDAVLLILL